MRLYFRYKRRAREEIERRQRSYPGRRVFIRNLSSTERKAHPQANYKVVSM